MRILFLINPHAGKKKKQKHLPQIKEHLARNGNDVEVYLSQSPQDIMAKIQNTDLHQYELLVLAGGDGSNFELINGMLKNNNSRQLPPILLLPEGRGNSFHRDLNIHTLEDGLRAFDLFQTTNVDVGKFVEKGEERYFINLLGFGFVTDVAITASHFAFLGDSSYVLGVLHRLFFMKTFHLKLEMDNTSLEGNYLFMEICNSRFTGGAMMMAPDAVINDGLLDVVLCKELSRMELLKTFPLIYKGQHLSHPAVSTYRCKRLQVHTDPPKQLLPDGEILGSTPLAVSILPGKLQYLYLP